MNKLQVHLLGFAEFHIEKKHSLPPYNQLELETITKKQFDDLCLGMRYDIWGSVREYIDLHGIKVEPFLENSLLLEEFVSDLNSFAGRKKYIIEDENIYVNIIYGSTVKRIMVYKNDLSYIGSYLLEYFYKNKEQLLEEYILRRTAILK
jgi:hypothetical protein